MEKIISRYRNATILTAVLFLQIILLAVQIQRPVDAQHPEAGSIRLIRSWSVTLVTPIEKAVVGTGHFFSRVWTNYVYLRGVRSENDQLKEEIERMRIEQVRLAEDARQARRLQYLLGFKEQFVAQTVAAQVIGSSGSEQSRLVYIDKGSNDGIRHDMAVITPTGIVGKVQEVFGSSAQVLLINDKQAGAGAVLEKSRLQGTVKGTAAGELVLDHVMNDEKVEVGERILTSGGDRVFPKGFPVGVVSQVSRGPDLFLNIRIKSGADLSRLEEVLVITSVQQREPQLADSDKPLRAADILADRLPTYVPPPDKDKEKDKAAKPPIGATPPQTKPEAKPNAPAAAPANGAAPAKPKKPAVKTGEATPGTTAAPPNDAKPKPKKPAPTEGDNSQPGGTPQ